MAWSVVPPKVLQMLLASSAQAAQLWRRRAGRNREYGMQAVITRPKISTACLTSPDQIFPAQPWLWVSPKLIPLGTALAN